MRLSRNNIAVMAALAVAIGTTAQADNRRFTFTYEATTMAAGEREYEQWVTWKTRKEDDKAFDRIDFRHELEFGVTDRFQLAFYLSDWRYEDGRSVDDNGAEWRNVAVEGILNLSDPTVDPIGSAVYGEVKFGDELFVLEAKLILQKNIGLWTFAWNGIVEAEWEGDSYEEDKAEFGNTLGASYQLTPSFSLGGELVHEIEYDDWSEWEDHVLYGGPVFAYQQPGWWLTVTPLMQLTNVDSEADFQLRAIFGIFF